MDDEEEVKEGHFCDIERRQDYAEECFSMSRSNNEGMIKLNKYNSYSI